MANSGKKRKWSLVLAIIFGVAIGGGIIVYFNFTRMLASALTKSFEKSLVSDIYELKFENLHVNLLVGDIQVANVVFQPRAKHLNNYPYINSSIRLSTEKLMLKNVKIGQLLKFQTLDLDKIEIDKPEIQLTLAGNIHVFFPFNDTTVVADKKEKKKSIQAFYLQKFELNDANFNATNSFEQREFAIRDVDFTFNDLYINQDSGKDLMSCKSVELSIESLAGTLLKSPLKHIHFEDYRFKVENIDVQKTIDTVVFHFSDFTTSLNDLDMHTADSIFHVSIKKFGLSYKGKSIKLEGVEFKPNISEAEMQKRHKFQNTQFAATVGFLEMVNVEFDSLIFKKKLLMQELILDSVSAALFKDKTKPLDVNKFPEYPGQQIAQIGLPMEIKKVVVKNGKIVNRERKPDGSYAKLTVSKLQVTATNFTTSTTEVPLVINGEGTLENTAHFTVMLGFDYSKPQFSIDARISQFNLKGLNNLLLSYTPAKINSGIVDELTFSGTAFKSMATGTLKFLYHDLNIDLQLQEQAKWKSSLGAFAANTYLHAANPVSKDRPAHIVKYEAERDMNKGFINIVLKSLFAGLKQTMIPSKENRKAFQETKKEEKEKKHKDHKK